MFDHLEHALPHSHDAGLVTLSVLIAILASYTALDLASRVSAIRGRIQYVWLLSGSVAMGLGIWSMHFVAMLAFRLPVAVTYDVTLVIVSLLTAILASALALFLASRAKVGWLQLILGGLLMGAAIAGMHYIGMAAMRLPAQLSYQPVWFALSIVIAIVASWAALWLAVRFRAAATRREFVGKVISAVVMGFAIASMHYTAMAAAVFVADASLPSNPPGSIAINLLGVSALAGGTVLVLAFAIIGSLLDQRVTRLSYPQKFSLISLLFVLPVAAFYPFVADQIARTQQYGYSELYGAYYLRPLQGLLQEVQAHTRLDRAYRNGNATLTQLTSVRERIEQHLQQLDEAQAQYATTLKVTTQASNIERRWERIKTRFDALTLSESGDEHQLLEADIQNLIRYVGDSSYLILDPELDTYYMMDAVLLKLPESQTLLAQIRTLGQRMLVSEVALTSADQAQLLAASTLLRANLSALDKNITTGLQANASGEMRPLVDSPLRRHLGATNELLSVLDAVMMGGMTLTPQSFDQLAEQTQQSQAAFYDAASQALELGIQDRIRRYTLNTVLPGAAAIVAIILAFWVGLGVMRAISRPLQQLTYAARQLAAGDMAARVAVSSQDEVGQVGSAFNDMARELQTNRVSLEARTRDLGLTAEISRALSQQRDLQQLLTQAAELIRTRFDLYYAQIYLLDESGHRLVLRAGTGEAGRELLNRNHWLPVDANSLNGAAALERRDVLVADTAANPSFRPNPLLPNTKAELSTPLLIGDRLLGVLDLQADRHGVLTRGSAGAFDSLSGQLAIAIENAVLFEQAERARKEVAAQARRLTRTGWEEFLDAVHKPERVEYTYAAGAAPAEDAPQLSAPIEVVGESVGGLQVVGAAQREWTPEDEALMEAVARQVAEQVEHLRLLAQADQYRAEAEHAVRRMTRDGWTNFAERSETPPGFVYDAETVAPDTGTPTLTSGVTQALTVRGEAIGEIVVEADATQLTPEQQRIIDAVADQLSAHIENLRLLDANQAALAETETLYNLNARLSAASTLEDILRATAEPGIEAGANDARLFLLELDAAGEPQVAALVATWQREGAPVMPVGTRFNTADFSFSRLWISDQHTPFVVADAQTDVRFDDAARSVFMQTQAIGSIILPLALAGKWLGLVLVNWTAPHAFTDAEARLYRALAGQAAVVVNNRLLFEEAQRRARRETIINSITQRIQNTVSIESALQTAVQEIGVALKAQQTRVEFGLGAGGEYTAREPRDAATNVARSPLASFTGATEPRNGGSHSQPARRES